MEEWMEQLVMERLDEQGYEEIDVADVEDAWDPKSIDDAKKKLCDEIDAAIQQALTEFDPDEEDEDDEEDDEEDEDEDDDWSEERWAARA